MSILQLQETELRSRRLTRSRLSHDQRNPGICTMSASIVDSSIFRTTATGAHPCPCMRMQNAFTCIHSSTLRQTHTSTRDLVYRMYVCTVPLTSARAMVCTGYIVYIRIYIPRSYGRTLVVQLRVFVLTPTNRRNLAPTLHSNMQSPR